MQSAARAPRQAYARHSSPARLSARARAGTRSRQYEAHRACAAEAGMARAPERARGEPARSTRRGRSTLAPPPRAIVPVRARESESTARILEGGSRSGILATTRRAARGLLHAGAQARPTCRGRSSVVSVVPELLHKGAEGPYGLARRRGSADQGGRGHPSAAHG